MTSLNTNLTKCNLQNTKTTQPTKTTTATTDTNTTIQTLEPYDILCGRFKTAFNNIGNRRFRVTINMNLQAYLAAKTKTEKSVLIGSITSFLQEEAGARFLKPQKGGGYIHLGEREVRQKVGHALRDMAVARQQSTMAKHTAKQQAKRCTEEKQEGSQHKTLEDDDILLESSLENLLSDLSSDSDDNEPLPLHFRR